MRAVVLFVMIALLALLTSCGGEQIDAQPLKTPTAAVVGIQQPQPEPDPEPVPEPEENTGKTAAEALKELSDQDLGTSSTGPKTARSLYPTVQTKGSGTDALKERTRALYKQSYGLDEAVDSDKTLGPRYVDGDNLPEGYDNDDSAGE